MTNDELFNFAASVKSRHDLIHFIEHLNIDYKENIYEWENISINTFLSGLSQFTNDMNGFYRKMGESVDVEKVTWRMVAQMLLAASVYGH